MSDSKDIPILMVDDEPNVLAGYRRTIGRTFNLTCAEGGAAGLAAIADSPKPYPVIITDMRMPVMTGLEFIMAARQRSRDSVYMMLTGNADQQTAVNAINQGHIFRFLNKPCPADLLESSVLAAHRQFEMVTAERVLLRDTFTGSIKFMTEALELANPELFSLQSQVKKIVQETAKAIGIKPDWQLFVAASLNLIGLMTIPTSAGQKWHSDVDLAHAAETGSRLLSHIPRIGAVVAMIRRQREVLAELPNELHSLAGDAAEAVSAQLLRFAVDFAQEQRRNEDQQLAAIRMAQSGRHDPRLCALFLPQPSSRPTVEQGKGTVKIRISELRVGMVLATDLCKVDGALLLSSGHAISDLALAGMRNFIALGLIDDEGEVSVETLADEPIVAKAA